MDFIDKTKASFIQNGINVYNNGNICSGVVSSKDDLTIKPSTFTHSGAISIGTDLSDEILKKVLEKFTSTPIISHKCHNCGGNLEIKENQHIFICPYCDSTYAIGTTQING